MSLSVTLLSPGQPSSNPRLVKEATALAGQGYAVTVIYCFWVSWADQEDEALAKQYPQIRWILVGGHPVSQKALYWFTRVRHKYYRLWAAAFPNSRYLQERAYARCYRELKKTAIKYYALLYIAHNLGALGPAAGAAKKNNTLYAFDAEDYHRGQSAIGDAESKTVTLLENRYIPGLAYCTAASAMIAARYAADYPGINPVTVNNVFSLRYLQPEPVPYQKGEPLKLCWFSQTTGKGRGLEEMIEAMGKVKRGNIHCTILGNCSMQTKNYFYKLADNNKVQREQLHFKEPVSLPAVFSIAAAHHIGMALEIGETVNRQVCLTNKIFTYLLSGLAIIATDTPAQKLFLEEHAGIGKYYPQGNIAELTVLLQSCIDDPATWNSYREQAYQLAKKSLNWEKEKEIFLQTVALVLKPA